MKITLDYKALERLIGGDTKLEVELRNCIVQEFANKHLKAIANSFNVKETNAVILTGVKQEIANTLGNIKAYPVKVDLQPKLKEEIENRVQQEFNKIFNSRFEEIMKAALERIERKQAMLSQMIDDKINADIQAVVDKKVGDKLNLIIQNIK